MRKLDPKEKLDSGILYPISSSREEDQAFQAEGSYIFLTRTRKPFPAWNPSTRS